VLAEFGALADTDENGCPALSLQHPAEGTDMV
jgi:hypothetical protein